MENFMISLCIWTSKLLQYFIRIALYNISRLQISLSIWFKNDPIERKRAEKKNKNNYQKPGIEVGDLFLSRFNLKKRKKVW